MRWNAADRESRGLFISHNPRTGGAGGAVGTRGQLEGGEAGEATQADMPGGDGHWHRVQFR